MSESHQVPTKCRTLQGLLLWKIKALTRKNNLIGQGPPWQIGVTLSPYPWQFWPPHDKVMMAMIRRFSTGRDAVQDLCCRDNSRNLQLADPDGTVTCFNFFHDHFTWSWCFMISFRKIVLMFLMNINPSFRCFKFQSCFMMFHNKCHYFSYFNFQWISRNFHALSGQCFHWFGQDTDKSPIRILSSSSTALPLPVCCW